MPDTDSPPLRIGIALGSGAARGLAHIPYVEAMDEMGLTPSSIAGTSIGALIGAGWAKGMTGKDLREHAFSVLGNLQLIAGKLWTTSRPTFKGIVESGISMQVDATHIAEAFLPDGFPDAFSALKIPFRVVATDFHSWQPVVFSSGSLRLAIAASLAIPSLFRPVHAEGRLYIDGGVTNPLPLDCIATDSDITIAIDVNGLPDERLTKVEPSPLDIGFVATQIMTQTLIRNMLERHPPDIYVQPAVNLFAVLEFWRVREILAAVETDKDRFKRALEERVNAVLRRAGRPLPANSVTGT